MAAGPSLKALQIILKAGSDLMQHDWETYDAVTAASDYVIDLARRIEDERRPPNTEEPPAHG